MTSTVRMPADVDRPDRLIGPLTARQLLIVVVTAVICWVIATTLLHVVPLAIAIGACVPIATVGGFCAVGNLDGLAGDRVLVALWRRSRTPAARVLTAGTITPAPLVFPARRIRRDGVIDCGNDGLVAICRLGSFDLGLRSDAEQEALVAGFARLLNGLGAAVQFVVHAERAELTGKAAEIAASAPSLARIELERAALDHAQFLNQLATTTELYRRDVLLVLREREVTTDAAARLTQRANELCGVFSGMAITATVVPTDELGALLGRLVNGGPGGAEPTELLGPDGVVVGDRDLQINDDEWCRTLAVTGYPRDVSAGWLGPLLSAPLCADLALHVEPVPAVLGAEQLRRQLARLSSSQRLDEAKGRLRDPELEVATADANDLAQRVARGQARLFRVGLYVTVRASSKDDLARRVQQAKEQLGSLLVNVRVTTFRALQGWLTTLPLGVDFVGLRRVMDTAALATMVPFAAGSSSTTEGTFVGKNLRSHGLVFWDRFAQPNYNTVILARSGSGKSYLAKLEVLRSLLDGVEVAVIDPQCEYEQLCRAAGGTTVGLGEPGVRINPFDLGTGDDALIRRCLFIHTLVATLVGEPDADQKAALDAAIISAYDQAGITADPRTHRRRAPVLADVARQLLRAPGDTAGVALARRLAPFVEGAHRGLFDGPTTSAPAGQLVVFSLRALPDELKAAGNLLVLDALWRRVALATEPYRRLVVVDEAWTLMADPRGAQFLVQMAKSVRKLWCGLMVVSQDAGDLLSSDAGRAIVSNAATQILLRQAPQAIDVITQSFGLSAGERAFVLSAERGDALVLGGDERRAVRVLASATEHALITTDPAEIAQLRR